MKVVIVGGGFGGVQTALKLANKAAIEVKLISSQTYFEYHAALYRSATGRSPMEVAIPLADFFSFAKNVEVMEDEITTLDNQTKVVEGRSGSTYSYDVLVLALGNVTELYGIEGLAEYAYGVKTIHQALKLKRHLHDQLIAAESDRNYVVVGAGATGVELSAELTSYLKQIRRKHKIKTHFTVDLIEAGPRVMAAMPEDFSAAIERRLRKLGVKLMLSTAVKSETINTIHLPSGPIKTHTVIWTAGVANNPFFKRYPKIFKLGKMNRAVVNQWLQAAEDVYVIGDSAHTPYSGMAQTALFDAKFLAKNILRKSRGKSALPYHPKQPVYAIPVGPRWAAVKWSNLVLYGRAGWLLRRLADLKLYITLLPFGKALTTWRYGLENQEVCPICKQ